MSTSSSNHYLIAASTALFITFLVLKLTGVIAWSWWWVTAPLWGGLALLLAVALVAVLCALIVGIIAAFFSK